MHEDFVNLVTDRYIELYEKITGDTFVKADNTDIENRIGQNVLKSLANAYKILSDYFSSIHDFMRKFD